VFEELLTGLFRIEIPLSGNPLGYLNSYVIKGTERNLVIDTGLNLDECHHAMLSGLNALGVDSARTDFFITHMHADHFGLVSRLVTEKSRVFMNKLDADILRFSGGVKSLLHLARRNGFPEHELDAALKFHPAYRQNPGSIPELSDIKDNDTITIDDYSFICIETPGHTRGHTCLYEPEKKILIAGDHILQDITPNILCWSDEENPRKDYLESLDNISGLEIDMVLPGHRSIIHHCNERIDELKIHHHHRMNEILSILAGGPKNAYEVASEMMWDVRDEDWQSLPVTQKWFATGETISHLRHLEAEGAILRESDKEGNTFLFYKACIRSPS